VFLVMHTLSEIPSTHHEMPDGKKEA